MARAVVDTWIPEEYGGPVITALSEQSVIERLARPEPMNSDTKHVPRQGAMTFGGAIAKGVAYGEDASTADELLLTARKFGKVSRLADEDLKDAAGFIDILGAKQLEWARVEALGIDNAALGVTAAENGTTIPFTSVYKSLRTTNAATGYTADANRVATAGTGASVTEAQISSAFNKIESSSFWSDADAVVIAHPVFKSQLRLLDPEVFNQTAKTLYDAPIYWTTAAKTNATASEAPTGNALIIVVNKQYLVKGVRSGPEYKIAGADSGAAFLTDEALIKMRIRRAFGLANENAAAVVELLP